MKFLGASVLNGTKYSRIDEVKFFKGCLPQILLGPFLNTWTQMRQNSYSKQQNVEIIKKLKQRKERKK